MLCAHGTTGAAESESDRGPQTRSDQSQEGPGSGLLEHPGASSSASLAGAGATAHPCHPDAALTPNRVPKWGLPTPSPRMEQTWNSEP